MISEYPPQNAEPVMWVRHNQMANLWETAERSGNRAMPKGWFGGKGESRKESKVAIRLVNERKR